MVAPGESAALASRLVGRTLDGERSITVDQTNHSVVVAEEVVVKWLQPPVLSPHPGVELLQHLASRGFTDVPDLIGCEQEGELVVAVVTRFIPDAVDGWEWFVDEVDAWLRDRRTLDDLCRWASRIGELTARLHVALADMQPTTVAARVYHAAAIERLDEALRTVDGREADHLRSLTPAVRLALAPLESDIVLAAHRIHGDLHAGQFLRSGNRLVVTDFDGNPLANNDARRLPNSPLVDVASMLQSIDHVGRIAVKRRHPDRAADVDRFVAAALAAACDAYLSIRVISDDLLHAFRVAQELHEYCYAAAHLPRWLYVPDAALPALLQ